ncbi:transcriptional regulator TetR family protein [Patulibacter medicamentivorans]|uniref:Transcriptional regulator TetR family protein n=1 Tax=Patulibacter medicamentivorans TaxID=1097667 RepID=H0E5I3_9ACTN|nr:hypothetical protein [Patulibacter medicamentivorans]EHN11058.1 transcriptional regulator TetR family protein [Patulibacter medicamentivorans]
MDERRRLIADACLALVGAHGVRALTHHRIDDQAGIARGSTSYYCRRRVDILRLALERLYALDLADIEAMVAAVPDSLRDDPAATAEAVAGLVVHWLEDEHRPRSIARIELFMAASHEPDLQPLIGRQFATIAQAVQPLGGRPATDGLGRAAAAFMLSEGLMLNVLRQGLPAPSRQQVADLLSLLGPPMTADVAEG